MTSDKDIFIQAVELTGAERADFLAEACQGDTTCHDRIAALLRSHEDSDGFLRMPLVARGGAASAETASELIGRYKLLEKIGEGGCGVVYLAEQQEPVRRRVALKVIKLGMDTKAVIARFEAERQALALMDHPNIARVFDAGATENGRPYFVMELVRGIPLTNYCDRAHLTPKQRIELVIAVCSAIQHAHQKGIIHRDLKPSNILVTMSDETPVPKVIDFGVAKATQGRLTDHTLHTTVEQFIGTPTYMSPEQAELSGLDIDARSDIYSLGVLLYELLAGHTPFDTQTFARGGVDAIRRQIREDEPVKPSTRLRTLTDPDRETVAKYRGTAPAELSLLLRGDLDWIVMRCLEKDRTRRYATASALALDLQRHLRHEPVSARPPSPAYLLGKLVRRHRTGFVTAGAAVATLLLGSAVGLWSPHHPARAPQAPVVAVSPSEAAFLIATTRHLLDNINYGPADLALAEKFMARATDLAPDSADAWALRGLVQATYLKRAWDLSTKRHQDAQDFCNRALALDPKQTEAMLSLAIVLNDQGADDQAEALVRQGIALRPDDPRLHRELATGKLMAGHLADGLAILKDTVRRFPLDPLSWYDLARSYDMLDDVPDALAAFKHAATLAPMSSAYLNIARLSADFGDVEGAQAAYDQMPMASRTSDRAVSLAMWLGLLEHKPDQVIAASNLTAADYFNDSAFRGPKAILNALAYEMADKRVSAYEEWVRAVDVLRDRLKSEQSQKDPPDFDRLLLAVALVWKGNAAEAAGIEAPIEAAQQEVSNPILQPDLAHYYAGLGDARKASLYLKNVPGIVCTRETQMDPWFMKIRNAPEFRATVAKLERERQPTEHLGPHFNLPSRD